MTEPLFTFIHVTDTHLSESFDPVTPFVKAVNSERFHARPDFVVFGGDNVSGSRNDGAVCAREMPLLKARLDQLSVPYHIVCHNHDTWGEPCRGKAHREQFGRRFRYAQDLSHGFSAVFMSGQYHDGDAFIEGSVACVEWLDRTLAELDGRRVLLFSHLPLFPPRKPVPDALLATLARPNWQASLFYYKPDLSQPVRDVIAQHGNVLVHYSGHCHVHSITGSAGTHYVTTAALASQPWEYRYVTVYPHRNEHRCIRPHALRKGRHFWTDCLDSDHPDVDSYHDGLPAERDFVIRY